MSVAQSGDFVGGNLHSILKAAIFNEVYLSYQRIMFPVIRMLGSPVSVRHSNAHFVYMIVPYLTYAHFCYYCDRLYYFTPELSCCVNRNLYACNEVWICVF